MRSSKVCIVFWLVALMSLASVQSGFAANYPLELTNIKAAGTGLDSNNRIYRAYPGLLYNIRAAVIGGDYPYTFSLSNAPAGMTINANTGEISWPSPQASAQPTITVRDVAGVQVSATWPIEVTTSGFRFVDAARGAAGAAGTAASPWRTMADVYNSAGANDIVYFRAGTYNQLSLPRTGGGGPWERVEWSGRSRMWIAYPGERPVIDFGYQAGGSEFGPLIRLDGQNAYIDGFETRNSHVMAFQVSGGAATFRKVNMHHHGPGGDGTNASMIMTTTEAPNNYMVIQDSQFHDSQDVMIKIYAQRKMLIEDSIFYNTTDAIELKDYAEQFTLRGNIFYNVSDMAIGGNMHESATSGEFLFNYVRAANVALDINQDAMASRIYTYRNTLVGRVRVRNTDGSDGPFYFSHNVIVSNDAGTPSGSHLHYESVSAPSRVIQTNNLAGFPSDNIVDANGNLTPAFAGYAGTHGHQRGSGPTLTLPSAPRNLRIVP